MPPTPDMEQVLMTQSNGHCWKAGAPMVALVVLMGMEVGMGAGVMGISAICVQTSGNRVTRCNHRMVQR